MLPLVEKDNSIQVKYNPQLDGLRFIAVFGVVCYHWIPAIGHWEISFFFGGLVNFFFVLSSFLITKILLSAREKSMRNKIPSYQVILYFLFRRTIRIFPAYYVFLILLICLPMIGIEIREHAGMYFAYLANYQIYFSQSWPAVTSHLWTLAVEEQFYLLWPLVIIFVPRHYLLKTFIFTIGLSILLRVLFFKAGNAIPQNILTQFSMDPFAVGGILAYQFGATADERFRIRALINQFLCVGIPLSILIIFFKVYSLSFYVNGVTFSLISMKIIEGAIVGYKGFMKRFLENRFVVFTGKISYGIYLYHLLVPVLVWRLYDAGFSYLGTYHAGFLKSHGGFIHRLNQIIGSPFVYFFLYAAITIVLAMISWNFIEMPLNNLKDRFRLRQKKQVSAGA